jgi:hypothetical protein
MINAYIFKRKLLRVAGIEPTPLRPKLNILPLNYTPVDKYFIKKMRKAYF